MGTEAPPFQIRIGRFGPEVLAVARFEGRDRIEAESEEFHRRVRAMFLRLAAGQPERYLVIDATRPVDDIAALVRERVTPLLTQATRTGATRLMEAVPDQGEQRP